MPQERPILDLPNTPRSPGNPQLFTSYLNLCTVGKNLQSEEQGRLSQYLGDPILIPDPESLEEIYRLLGIKRRSKTGQVLNRIAQYARRAQKAEVQRRLAEDSELETERPIYRIPETSEAIEAALERARRELLRTGTIARPQTDSVVVVIAALDALVKAAEEGETLSQVDLVSKVLQNSNTSEPNLALLGERVWDILRTNDEITGFSHLEQPRNHQTSDERREAIDKALEEKERHRMRSSNS